MQQCSHVPASIATQDIRPGTNRRREGVKHREVEVPTTWVYDITKLRGFGLMILTEADVEFLKAANKLRERVSKPRQSFFRVVALVVYKDTNGDLQQIFGVNDEPCHISGSICAERNAFLQLRLVERNITNVLTVYLVTDSNVPVLPGMLCREFVFSSPHVQDDMPIISASQDYFNGNEQSIKKVTISELYPAPSIFARLNIKECLDIHQKINEKILQIELPPHNSKECKVWNLAIAAAKFDNKAFIHDIGYGAAVLCENNTYYSAWQKKAIEYGCSLCPVTQLAQKIEEAKSKPAYLIQVDQAGIAHAPFAIARSYLSEYGYGDCKILFHELNTSGRLVLKQATVNEICKGKLDIFK